PETDKEGEQLEEAQGFYGSLDANTKSIEEPAADLAKDFAERDDALQIVLVHKKDLHDMTVMEEDALSDETLTQILNNHPVLSQATTWVMKYLSSGEITALPPNTIGIIKACYQAVGRQPVPLSKGTLKASKAFYRKLNAEDKLRLSSAGER